MATTLTSQGILGDSQSDARAHVIELLTKAYWMEVETVMSYLAASVNPDGVRALADLGADALGRRGVGRVVDDDLGAGARQLGAHRGPDAARAARHERHLPAKLTIRQGSPPPHGAPRAFRSTRR